MKSVWWCVMVLSLCSCATSPKDGSGDFYTWIDDRGQLQTLKRDQNKSEARASNTRPTEGKNNVSAVTPNGVAQNFNPDDFTSSEQIDEKLKETRLFAWQDDSGQRIEEVDKADLMSTEDLGEKVDAPQSFKMQTILPENCCLKFAEFQRHKWSDIKDKEMSLEDLYIHIDEYEQDVIVIELDEPIEHSIRILSFIRSGKIALPDVAILGERYNVLNSISSPYSHYVEESWASYGYLQGRLEAAIFKGGYYLVLTPSPQLGILEFEQKRIKISNFGSIMVRLDASVP